MVLEMNKLGSGYNHVFLRRIYRSIFYNDYNNLSHLSTNIHDRGTATTTNEEYLSLSLFSHSLSPPPFTTYLSLPPLLLLLFTLSSPFTPKRIYFSRIVFKQRHQMTE
uniref:Uncharacterized protein n=1 Tax=Cacopsylla melanoneura TaxID=428564 RepID=A0A8D8U082_9HEMI